MKKITILSLLIMAQTAFAQTFSVFNVDASSFPTIYAKFYAFDATGNQITNLNNSDFEVWENGTQRNGIQVSCPAPQPPKALSSVLVIDVSGSMDWGPGSSINIELAKAAARAWVNALPLGKSECAISTFDHYNYLNQDFTTDKNKLLDAITPLTPNGGTDYDAALISPVSGGLLISRNGKYQKVIVMLTDGQAGVPQINTIVSESNNQNCIIYTVTLGMDCPQSLKDISEQTGGQWFENVTTIQEAEEIYRKILRTAQGGDPCEMIWESGISCTSSLINLEIKLVSHNISENTKYSTHASSVAKLEFSPKTVKFENPIPNEYTPAQKVTVTAVNSDFSVDNITTNNSGFDISPKNFNLKAGESIELSITYFPVDKGYNYCKMELESQPCNSKFYISGGWKGIKPTMQTIKLLHPNGNEVFVAGSDTVITWEGVSPDEPVKLEYRTDDNQPWVTIADSAKGLSHPFRVPLVISDKYLARVTAVAPTYNFCNNPDLEICGKIWMGCNLDVDTYRNGEAIRHCQTDEEWQDANSKQEGAWCFYDNSDSLGAIYGRLYNWYAVNDPRGLAPEGWHVPTDAEWKELEMCLGMTKQEADKSEESRGTNQGSQLAGREDLWNDGALENNVSFGISGFSALPGGYRIYNGTFYNIGYFGNWWSNTEFGYVEIWIRYLSGLSPDIFRGYRERRSGFSVRCVMD